MPILPIDLQTIFSQIGTVGREQAALRDLAPLQQTAQATALVQSTYRQDRSVNETQDSREGERVADEERRRGRGRARAKGAAAEEADQKEEKGEGGVFRDPALGTRIDVVR